MPDASSSTCLDMNAMTSRDGRMQRDDSKIHHIVDEALYQPRQRVSLLFSPSLLPASRLEHNKSLHSAKLAQAITVSLNAITSVTLFLWSAFLEASEMGRSNLVSRFLQSKFHAQRLRPLIYFHSEYLSLGFVSLARTDEPFSCL